ncbi:MAG: hypothetical protein J5590_03215 [Clostridia bacterium]|nr:hypothetical protein [Clostridia bacterium]
MKKWQIVLIGILLVLLVTAGIFSYIHKDRIKILYKGMTMSTEDILKEKEKIDERAKQAAKDYGIDEIRPLSEEESEMLKSGELTEEEAINLILGYTDLAQPGASPSDTPVTTDNNGTSTVTPANNNSNNTTDSGSSQQNGSALTASASPSQNNTAIAGKQEEDPTKEKVARLLGKMYVLKSQFTSDLAGIEADARAEFKSLPKEERKQESTKWRIGADALDRAADLEDECDAEVNAVLDELTAVLNEANQSTGLVDEVRSSYEAEKEVTKSYYISKFQE